MTDSHDRRQELRREEDEEVRIILARYGVRLDQHDNLLGALGPAGGHLALLDSRVDDHEKRFDKFERDIRREIHDLRNDVGAVKVGIEGLRAKVGVWTTLGALVGSGLVTLAAQILTHH